MPDTRSRHRPIRAWSHDPDNDPVPYDKCEQDGLVWPCDAIREADRADDLNNRLIGTVEALTDAEHRADTAEGLLVLARRDLDKAEAALANVQAVFMRLQEFCESSEPGLLDAFWFTEHNRPASLMEVSIVHTDAAPGEMDEHGAWGFKGDKG